MHAAPNAHKPDGVLAPCIGFEPVDSQFITRCGQVADVSFSSGMRCFSGWGLVIVSLQVPALPLELAELGVVEEAVPDNVFHTKINEGEDRYQPIVAPYKPLLAACRTRFVLVCLELLSL